MGEGKANLSSDHASTPSLQPTPDPSLSTGFSAHLAPRTRSVLLTLLLACTFLAPIQGAAAYYVTHRREEALIKARFDEYLGTQAFSLREKMLAIGENLYSLRSHFHASTEVTRKEFATYAKETCDRFRAIQALELVVYVRGEDRHAHEASGVAAGLPDYEIRCVSKAGEMVRAPPADLYYPAFFVEPKKGNEAALGFDLACEATRLQALTTAFETDRVTFSDPIRLVQSADAGLSTLAVVPVLKNGANSGRAGIGQVKGFALIALPIRDLVEWALPPPVESDSVQMEFQLVHEPKHGPERVLYRPSTVTDDRPPLPWLKSLTVEAGGQSWRLDGRPTEVFAARSRDTLPVTLGIAGTVLWVLFFGNLYLIARWSRGRELKKRDRVVRSVLANLSEGVIVADRQGEIQLANTAAGVIVGIPHDEIGLEGASALLGCYKPDTVTRYPDEELPLNRAMRGEKIEEEQIFVRNAQAPQGRWLSVSGSPLMDSNQISVGGVAVIRDITEHKKAEDVLKRLSNAVEQTADVVFITNRGGMIEYVNPAFESTFGFTKEEVIGRTPRILRSGVHEREHYQKLWDTILAGRVFQSLTINRKKNGELIHTVQTITPMKDGNARVTHFVSVCTDITERRRREEHEAEMRVAAVVQQRLFPEQSLKLEGLDLAGAAFPAAATCGDYFDFFSLSDGGVALAIGDVCGHGLGAALLMAETRAYLRSLMRSRTELQKAFEVLNRSISEDVESGVFVTLLAAHLDRKDRSLVYASAGHVPGYILNQDGEIRLELPPTGPALGILEDQACTSSARIQLRTGDLLLLLTDGVTETRSPEGAFFEESRALSLIREHRDEPAKRIVERIYAGTREFARTRPQHDDITMVVCKVE